MRRTKPPVHYERLRIDNRWYFKYGDWKRLVRKRWPEFGRLHWLEGRPGGRLISATSAFDKLPCVYLLLHQGKVIYIGASKCVKQRIKTHFKNGKVFDEVRLLPKADYLEVEQKLIQAFQPPLNIRHNPSRPQKRITPGKGGCIIPKKLSSLPHDGTHSH